jgi:hypothetical protein
VNICELTFVNEKGWSFEIFVTTQKSPVISARTYTDKREKRKKKKNEKKKEDKKVDRKLN